MLRFLFLVVFCFISFAVIAQQQVEVYGSVVSANEGQPIPYATVAISNSTSGQVTGGTTTNDNGEFSILTDGEAFSLEITFIGFEKKLISGLSPVNGRVNAGIITLLEKSVKLEEVQVTGEKSTVEFKLDKRVFNVGKDISSTGMSALEVLNKVPSVNVDIEGQVSLRGNTGVQILIDGKPSVLSDDRNNALGTLTADMMESVEVITNPSAKYEAGGTAGIINIILKKEEKRGFNGSVSVNTGIPDNHSIGVSLNRRTEHFNFFTQFGAGYRSLPTTKESINDNLNDGTLVESKGTEYRNENFYNITLGTDYHINPFNVLTLSGNFAYEVEDQPSETGFNIYDSLGGLETNYKRIENTSATNPKYQYDLQYKRQYRNHEDHVLLFSALGRFFGKKQSSVFDNSSSSFAGIPSDQQTETNFYDRYFTYKLDYTNPLTKTYKLETGALFETNDVGNDYAVFNQEPDGSWAPDLGLTNNFEYDQHVLGLYGTGSYEGEKWGVKLGLRMEHTGLRTLLTTTRLENDQNYTKLFPSAHTSYKISKRTSLQAGYSRRIFRPRLWDLNPFLNIKNNYNIRRGNPDLQPEYSDSYELTYILILEKFSVNTGIYHLYTTDVIERISFFENNISIITPINTGTRRQTGLEINGKLVISPVLSLNGDFNYGLFSRKGYFGTQDFTFNGDKWFTRLTARLKLPAEVEVELSGEYQSPSQTVQGQESGFAFSDLGIRKKLWKGKLVVNFTVSDIFSSRIRENTVSQTGYYLYDFSERGRFFTLGLSFGIGKGEAMTYSGRRR